MVLEFIHSNLCSSIERVGPIGIVLQRLRRLHRRKCLVKGPNALWLVFCHPSFHYRVYFQIRFFLQNVLRKACTRRKLIW